jgi:hypothetical protein
MMRVFDLLIVAGTAVLSIRLLTTGLYRQYKAFLLYLIFATLHSGVLTIPRPDSKLYYEIWIWTEPVEWLFFVLVVLEVYSLVLQNYRGLATAGRWFIMAAVAVALLASALMVIAPSHHSSQGPTLTYYYIAERAVYFSLVVFLLTTLGLLMRYPIPLSRNVIVHSVVFSIYFFAVTIIYTVLSMFGPGVITAVTLALDGVMLAALVIWIAMLNPAGEEKHERHLRPNWAPGREEELVGQLNNLNAALMRATRK